MMSNDEQQPLVVDTHADVVDTQPVVDQEELHQGVAERLRHSQQFGALIWDDTKDYVQKMNLTAEERMQLRDWLSQKRENLQSKVVEKLHNLHRSDDNPS